MNATNITGLAHWQWEEHIEPIGLLVLDDTLIANERVNGLRIEQL